MARISKLNITIEEAKKIRQEMLLVCTEETPRPDLGPCQVIPKKLRESSGYGRWYVGTDHYRAHRLMYVLVNGMIPDHMVTMHRCDNPPCVRIDHLKYGTIADNNFDRHEKGRTLSGEKAPGAKMTQAEARVAFKLVAVYGVSGRKVAKMFEIHHKSIQRLISGEKWNDSFIDRTAIIAAGRCGASLPEKVDISTK